jgi:uncharacterized membrane protein YeiH
MLPGQAVPVEAAFELPVPFSLLAHFTFGATGALAGIKRGYDVVGILFLSLITALGGGLIRDGVLISKGPATVLVEGSTIGVVVLAAVLSMILYSRLDRLGKAIAIIDAIGLGAFAVYGVQRSLNAGLNTPAAIIGGTITALGGGILRDILVRVEPLLFKPGQFYGLVAILGCCMYAGLPKLGWVSHHEAAYITIVAVFVVRLLAIRFNWRTRAMGREPTPAPPT